MRRLVIAVLALAAVAGLIVLVSSPPTPDSMPVAVAKPKTLRVGIVTLPADKGYPWNTTGIPNIFTFRAMFEGLTYVTEDGMVEPLLATSWEAVDPLTWRFKLRQNATFHNGKPFTADAVVFAVAQLTRPGHEVDSTARELNGLKSAEAEGPFSVLIHTKRPEPLLPAALELMSIVEPEHFQQLGRDGFADAPIGTGPFKFVRWNPAGADFAAHKEGWRPPKVDFLELIEMPEIPARVQGVLSDRVDLVVSIGYENAKEIEAAGGKAFISRDTGVLGTVFVLTKLPKDHPLHDKRVRQALNYAVNKEAYITALFGGLTKPASQPAVASSFGFNHQVAPYPYDAARAKAMLTEAGYPEGFSFEVDVPASGGAAMAESYQMVAADLARIGVKMTIHLISVPQLNRGVLQGEWGNAAFGTNYGAQRTTDSLRAMKLHSCIHPHAWYCNEELRPIVDQAYNAATLDERRALTERIMGTYHDEAPAIWMHELMFFEGLGPRVRNYRSDIGVIRYDQIELVDEP
ncbi:MAG: ABC transporter substrate-binding protein [Alphaproteobacteria bacterium]|nr:ABC transporter substrate-binding protein [Alphaproteobacteria bacterium]